MPVYLDYNATTPVDPSVLEAMMPYFSEKFGNAASRTHAQGWQAADAVETGLEQIASLIGAGAEELVITSGATESANLAIKGVFEACHKKGNHIVAVSTEHKAVLDTCQSLEKKGARITLLNVDETGMIQTEELEKSISPDTILVCAMYANNETGVIHPIQKISEIVHARNALLFCDATQAAGKIPVNVLRDGIDLLCFSGHKMYAPKGAGVLYVRRKSPRVTLIPQIDGGGHQRGLRSGTLNVPGIVGMGKACEIAAAELHREASALQLFRDRMEHELNPFAKVNGGRAPRLPHVSNLCFPGRDSAALIGAMPGIAVATGSACTSASVQPSHVLKAMGMPDADVKASIRISLGRFTTTEEITFAIEKIRRAATA